MAKKTEPDLDPERNAEFRPLGRVQATAKQWRALKATMVLAPRIKPPADQRRSPHLARFRPAVPWFQRRGFCVGWTGAIVAATTLNTPENGTEDSPPARNPPIVLSPLFSYDISRMECLQEGIHLGNEDGSIVGCLIRGAGKMGKVLWSSDPAYGPGGPDDNNMEERHPNDNKPEQADLTEGLTHVCMGAMCESFDHGLEMNKAGFSLDMGSSIPQGFMNTDTNGRFTWSGKEVGGHSYQLVEHDETSDTALIGNNWPQWGIRQTGLPSQMQGYLNIAICSLTDLRAQFTPAKMRSGASEIGVISDVRGFSRPLIRLDFSKW